MPTALHNHATSFLELVDKHGPITRSDLASLTGLSAATISNVVRQLLDEGRLEEETRGNQSPTNTGRPTKRLQLPSEKRQAWLIEVGSTHVRMALSDYRGHLKKVTELDISPQLRDDPVRLFSESIEKLRAVSATSEPTAVGIALPGPVDPARGGVVHASRIPGWNNINLTECIAQLTPAPVFIENDTRAGARGEMLLRSSHSAYEALPDNAIYVKASTGIGGTAIIGGEIVTGHAGLAGDISHSQVPEADGLPCTCGLVGCVEQIASGAAMLRELAASGVHMESTADFVSLAQSGDVNSTTLARRSGGLIGRVLAPLITFLNPKAVIVGGSLSSIPAFMAGINAEIYASCLPMSLPELIIEPSHSKADAALLGMSDVCYSALKNN